MIPGAETFELQSLSRGVSTRKLAPDWLHRSEQPIRSQVTKLTQLLTVTTTHKFPVQDLDVENKSLALRLDVNGVREEETVLLAANHSVMAREQDFSEYCDSQIQLQVFAGSSLICTFIVVYFVFITGYT